MRKLFIAAFYLFFVMISSCGSVEEEQVFETKEEEEIIIDNIEESEENTSEENTTSFKLLSLGDSYTIGQSVCETCRFPEQLKDSLLKKFNDEKIIDLKADFSPKVKSNFNNFPYLQTFIERFGHIQNLSVLDLLFNEGPNSICILEESSIDH